MLKREWFSIGIVLGIAIWFVINTRANDPEFTVQKLPLHRSQASNFYANKQSQLAKIKINVSLSETGKKEKVALETYVQGVLAAEMLPKFHFNALKAQAIVARTFILQKYRTILPEKRNHWVVTDTVQDQVYLSQQKMKDLQKKDYASWNKIHQAVETTKGQILVYHGEPIKAFFFSTSNGYTENSEEVFLQKLPYLRSVPSPWDRHNSPRSEQTLEMDVKEFYTKLGMKDFSQVAKNPSIHILSYSKGKRVKEIVIGNKKLLGTQVRHLLGLTSTAFDIQIIGNQIKLIVYGSGHGVGMSQWGAQGMALEGKSVEQILNHYYKGAILQEAAKLKIKSSNKRYKKKSPGNNGLLR